MTSHMRHGTFGARVRGEGERMETLPAQSHGREARTPRSRVAGFFALVASVIVILAGCADGQTPGAPSVLATHLSTASAVATPQFDPSVGAPLPNNRIVAAYGIVGGIEANGPASTLDMLDNYLPQLQDLGKQYAALDPIHPVKLGIDLVVNVIQPCSAFPQYCASWADDDTLKAYIDFSQKHNLYLFLDVQLGTEPVEHAVTQHLLPYLQKYPFVELALDTEFHFPNTPDGYAQAAGYPCCLGWMGADEVNWAIHELAQISVQQQLPRKVLIVHEWNSYVLHDKDKIKRDPGVSLVLQSDGFGGYDNKLGDYQIFVQQELLEYGGYKLFLPHCASPCSYDVDPNGVRRVQSPQDVMSIFPQPLFISYQ